jgi:hypothetical protein
MLPDYTFIAFFFRILLLILLLGSIVMAWRYSVTIGGIFILIISVVILILELQGCFFLLAQPMVYLLLPTGILFIINGYRKKKRMPI